MPRMKTGFGDNAITAMFHKRTQCGGVRECKWRLQLLRRKHFEVLLFISTGTSGQKLSRMHVRYVYMNAALIEFVISLGEQAAMHLILPPGGGNLV